MKVVNSATFGTFLAHTLHFCETSIIETMHILCIGFGLQVHFIGVKEKYILKKHKEIEIGTTQCSSQILRKRNKKKLQGFSST